MRSARFPWRHLVAGCLFLAGCLLLAGCQRGPTVFVDLRTDLVPGAEFQALEIWLERREGSGATEVGRARRSVSPDDRFIDGVRVAELAAPGEGVYHVRARLYASGGILATGGTLVRVREDTVVSVRVERACAYAGCAEGQLCERGECVDEDCALTTPGECGETPACASPADCPARADCADARCDEGFCFFEMREGACAPTDYCDPQRGCLRFPEQSDAGAPMCGDTLVDCDDDPSDCEVNVALDPNHCGGCDVRCEIQNATALCASGACSLLLCDPGFGDCDGDESSGCETSVTTVAECGDCGVACGASETCTSIGQCRCGARFGGIGSGPACLGSETCCGDACADLQRDPTSCGACGAACAPGETCRDGQCACGPGRGGVGAGAFCGGACCDDACVDLDADVANCGACGVRCGDGESCDGGECRCGSTRGSAGPACGPTETCCTDACADLGFDEASCGGCGIGCGPGEFCNAGACQCGTDAGEVGAGRLCGAAQTCCGTGCQDTDADTMNCGGCGVRCGRGERCAGGACRCGSASADPGDGALCSVVEECCLSMGATQCASSRDCS